MRIIFFGTSEFALPTLETLIENGIKPIAVVTQPDRPGGRGKKLISPPVKQFAVKNHLKIYQPLKARSADFISELKLLKPDLILVAAYGQILPKDILQIPPYGCINVHPSLLPKYRGAAPIQRAIMNQETKTGVTIMLIDEGADTGDIIIQQEEKISNDDSSLTLSNRLANLGAELVLKTIKMINNANALPPHFPQSESEANYAPKLEKEDGNIDWSLSASKIEAIIRGTFPWPGAYTNFKENPLKIVRAEVELEGEGQRMEGEKDEGGRRRAESGVSPGMIVAINDRGIVVATGLGNLVLTILHPANRNEMSAKDFVNGYRVEVGERFGKD